MDKTTYICDDRDNTWYGLAARHLDRLQQKYPNESREDLANKFLDKETQEILKQKGIL